MNAKQLRDSILQMAIEGKLVPQLNSEPAVEQIGAAPKEVPFEIPEKWKWVQIRTLGKTTTGSTPPKNNPNYYGNDIPFVNPGDIQDYKITFRSDGLSNEARSLARIVSPFSILMVCIGGCIGKCAISSISTSFNQQINALTPDEVHSHKLIFYFLISQYFQNEVKKLSTGTATPIINKNKWSSIYIPLPPLEEQKRIVAKLEKLMPLVEDYGKAYDALEELNGSIPSKLKQSILQYAMEGKLVPQLDCEPAVEQIGAAPKEVPFEIPAKWKWVALKNVGSVISGGTPKTGEPSYWGDDIAWVTPADLGKNNAKTISCGARSISFDGLSNSSAKKIPAGSVIYSSRAPIGHIAIANNEITTNQGCKSLAPNFELITTDWAYYSLIARTKDIKHRATGTTFKEISGTGFGATQIPLPPLEEQKRIVAKIEALFEQIDRMQG